jgi:hypothetical protein
MSPSDVENKAIAKGNLGLAALFQGNQPLALEQLSACLEMCRDLGMLRVAAEALIGLATHAALQRDVDRALTLWAAADALRSRGGLGPTAVEDRLRTTFLEPLLAAGASLPSAAPTTLDGAAAYALAVES